MFFFISTKVPVKFFGICTQYDLTDHVLKLHWLNYQAELISPGSSSLSISSCSISSSSFTSAEISSLPFPLHQSPTLCFPPKPSPLLSCLCCLFNQKMPDLYIPLSSSFISVSTIGKVPLWVLYIEGNKCLVLCENVK